MEEEFEVTYFVKEIPEGLFDASHKEILDIYIPKNDHSILRIRKSGDRYEITKKIPVSGTDSSHQLENTIPLTEEEYKDLAIVEGKRVRKIRYYYGRDGVQYEVDIFQDTLEGLITVDVEFKDREALEAFVAPDWFLADITQEKFIAGGVLSGKSYGDLEEDLNRFNYTRL